MNKKMRMACAALVLVATGCCPSSTNNESTNACNSCPAATATTCSVKQNLDSLKLVMLISIKTKPDGIDAFVKAINKCAAETLKEPGCLDYTIYQSPNDPTLFTLTESWENKATHRAHMDAPHIKVYFEEIKTLIDHQNNPRPSATYRICPELQN